MTLILSQPLPARMIHEKSLTIRSMSQSISLSREKKRRMMKKRMTSEGQLRLCTQSLALGIYGCIMQHPVQV